MLKDKILDLIYPREYPCMACRGEGRLDQRHLCSKCANGLMRISAPCPVCGRENKNKLCQDCADGREFVTAVAAYRYKSTAKSIVRALKYRDDGQAAQFMADAVAAVCDITANYSFIAGVPSRRESYVRRGYNQSDEIAKRLSAILDVPFVSALGLKGKIGIQHLLSRQQRRENYANGLYCKCDVTDAKILLIDDVLTTGATAEACAKVLRDAGAASIYVAVFSSVSFKEATELEKHRTLLEKILFKDQF